MDSVDILLVEDNPYDQELTLRSLKKYKLTNNIFLVEDGEEALDFIFSKEKYSNRKNMSLPKLILLDLKLPKVNGLEVLKELKDDERTKAIPVVILTSSKEEKDVVKSYNLGVNSYIVKPVDFDKFVESVKEIGMYWMLLNHSPNRM